MNFDVFTVSALVDEFMDNLVGGRVQDVIDVDRHTLGLEIYANHQRQYLLLSADNQNPHVYVAPDKLRRGTPKPTQVGLLFRRYVERGIVTHVSQPDWERILQIDIEGPEGEVTIIIEPMPRRSNILLVQDGTILDCMRRVGPKENRYRLSLPAHEYILPPPQTGKLEPDMVDIGQMSAFFEDTEQEKKKAHQVLVSNILGISPLLAREIVFRAHDDSNIKATDADVDLIFSHFETLLGQLRSRDWQPCIAHEDELPVAFATYPLQQFENFETVDSISEALSQYYEAPTGIDAYNAAKTPVFEALDEATAKLTAKLNSLEQSMTDDSQREYLKQSGELILAYQYTLQEGQTELRATYDPSEPELVIKLDPQLSPLENAQKYFDRYNKAKRALNDVPELIEETTNELNYIKQLRTDLELASNWPEIDEVQQVLQSKGYWQRKKVKRIGGGGQSQPIRFVTDDAFVIWVGRNSRQNEIVTFKKASGDDLWLHARDVPGAHVIIKNDGRTIPEEVIDQAASLAAYYSALRNDGRVPVDVTRIKYVRKIKGAAQGMVTYRNESTRLAVPHDEKSL